MADTKLSALTAKTTAADADLFYLVDSATSPITSKGITYANLEARLRDATIITDLAEVTAASTDYLLILDVSASPQALKKVLVSDLLDNATHTGDVTGSTALTIQPEAISGKGEVTASGSDYVLILDTSTSPNSLKKALVSDLGSAFGVSDITGAGAITVAGGDLLVAVDVSASPQVLGQVTAQAVADLFDASGYLPLTGGTMTGSIAFAASSPEHTVDGRNVSADGAKLDTIETNADVTDTANVTAAGALMDSEVTNLAAVKAFDPTDYATAAQGSTADTAMQPGDDAAGLGSGAATDGHVLTADGAGGAAWEAPSGGGAMTLVGSATVSGSAATSMTVSGLDLSAFTDFRAICKLENATGSGANIYLHYNGDTTATNYYRQSFVSDNTTNVGGRGNDPFIAFLNASNFVSLTLDITNGRDGKPAAISQGVENAGSSVRMRNSTHVWTTAANVTSITITSSVSNALAVGSTIRVYGIP